MIYAVFAMGFLLVWAAATIRSFWFAVMHTLRAEGSELFTDDELCVNCGDKITFYAVVGRSGYWVHPDLVDEGCHGTQCADGEESAEPCDSARVR